MATIYGTADRLRAEAVTLDPLKVLITLLVTPFFVVGWAARLAWVIIALVWTGAVHGWRLADEQVKAREAAARGS